MAYRSMAAATPIVLIPPLAVGQEGQATASNKASMDAHQRMMRSMPTKPSCDTDRDFASMMIPHHQGAIDMARIDLRCGKNPELCAMATKMIVDDFLMSHGIYHFALNCWRLGFLGTCRSRPPPDARKDAGRGRANQRSRGLFSSGCGGGAEHQHG